LSADVLRLDCKNFRSYGTLVLSFSSKFVVFYGENGAGKTNILEALSLFSSDRGLRKAPIADLNSSKALPFSWNLELVLKKSNCKTFLTTNVQNGRRCAKIDGASVDSLARFEEMVWILWLTPSMNNIFIGPIADRRSFFDHLVSGYDKRHKYVLKTLSKLQKERQHVLFHSKDRAWLDVLEKKIAEENVKIIKSRQEFISILNETFEYYPSNFLRPSVRMHGAIEEIYGILSEEDAILEISNVLQKYRTLDLEKQTTTISCQKTLWQLEHQKTNLPLEKCSTGEQKAFLISLIMAAVRIYQKIRTGIPVLLLDDLMVHLDKVCRKALVDELLTMGVQTFFTGTDRNLFEELSGIAQMYHVQKSICNEQD
jgi:DNA replication and repair protein RecF